MSQVNFNTPENSSAEGIPENAENQIKTRPYDQSIFFVQTLDGVQRTMCSECVKVKRQKTHEFSGEIRSYNVKRHWRKVHSIDLVSAAHNNIRTALVAIPDQARAKKDMVELQLTTRQSLASWDTPIMKKLFKVYVEECGVFCSSAHIKQYIAEECAAMRLVIGNRVRYRMFSVEFDIASRNGKTILGITIKFVDLLEFGLEVITIGMIPLAGTSGEILKQKINECLAKYGLSLAQVYCYTTDNGKNVLKATRVLLSEAELNLIQELNDDEEDDGAIEFIQDGHPMDEALIRCAAHTIQLAVNDFLKPMQNTLRNIRTEVHNMRRQLKKKGLAQPPLSNKTR